MKKLALYIVLGSITLTPFSATANTIAPKKLYGYSYDKAIKTQQNPINIKLEDNGAYDLKFTWTDSAGNKLNGKIYRCSWSICETQLNNAQPNSTIHLKAVLGKSTNLTLNKSGTISCTGTTEINFKCAYK